jgi:hypothetical protein
MTTLILVDVDHDNQVLATIVADGDDVRVTGPRADVAKAIVHNRAVVMGVPDGKSLQRLAEYGWTNGHLALKEK